MFQISILLVEINPFMKRVTQDPYPLHTCVAQLQDSAFKQQLICFLGHMLVYEMGVAAGAIYSPRLLNFSQYLVLNLECFNFLYLHWL